MPKLLLLSLTVLLLGAVLFSSVQPVAACSCAFHNDPEQILEGLEQSEILLVEGAIAAPDSSDHLKFRPDVVYWGQSPRIITIDQPWIPPQGQSAGYDHLGADCSYTLTGREGDRYLLSLWPTTSDPSIYRAFGCASFAMVHVDGVSEQGSSNTYRAYYEALVAATGGGVPVGGQPDEPPAEPEPNVPDDGDNAPGTRPQDQPEGEHKDTPWLIVLPLAFGIPLAVLLLPSFLSRRTQGH